MAGPPGDRVARPANHRPAAPVHLAFRPEEAPRSAQGYDFDGATFTHVGNKLSFEVVAESFGLNTDPALQRLAALVHDIDVGGVPVDEAPGFQVPMRGLQARHADDDALLCAALTVFDAFHAALKAPDEQ